MKEAALSLFLALSLAAPLMAQKGKLSKNAPANCPWCHGDKEMMKVGGIFSHGGFDFAAPPSNTGSVDEFFAGKDVYWIESAHFELGLALGPQKVGPDEAKRIRAELTELAEFFPEVDTKARVLEPFMRTHIYALRVEKAWKRFLELMCVRDSDFPDGKSVWLLGTPYWGEGPYVGQKGKFELLVLPTATDQVSFLQAQFGLTMRRTQRWNVTDPQHPDKDRSTLIVTTNLTENELYTDIQLYGHCIFNLAIQLLDGFKHYSYDTPCWIREGLGHLMEREITPKYNTYDASEGSLGVKVNKENWDVEVKEIITAGKAPRLAELCALKSYAEFDRNDHYACWSMTKFMATTNPEGYGCLNKMIHGRKRPDGMPDAEDLAGVMRDAFTQCFGMSYPQFDEAWRAWAMGQ